MIVAAVSLLRFLELAPLSYLALVVVFGYVLVVSFLINDQVKVHIIKKDSTVGGNSIFLHTLRALSKSSFVLLLQSLAIKDLLRDNR